MSIVHDHRPYPDDDPVCTPVAGLKGAFQYLCMNEQTAGRAVQVLHGIVTDPIAADFHRVIEQDTTRIFEGVQRVANQFVAPTFGDARLAALFVQDHSLDGLARDVMRLVGRLPAIAQWYDDSDQPLDAEAVRALHRNLKLVTKWM